MSKQYADLVKRQTVQINRALSSVINTYKRGSIDENSAQRGIQKNASDGAMVFTALESKVFKEYGKQSKSGMYVEYLKRAYSGIVQIALTFHRTPNPDKAIDSIEKKIKYINQTAARAMAALKEDVPRRKTWGGFEFAMKKSSYNQLNSLKTWSRFETIKPVKSYKGSIRSRIDQINRVMQRDLDDFTSAASGVYDAKEMHKLGIQFARKLNKARRLLPALSRRSNDTFVKEGVQSVADYYQKLAQLAGNYGKVYDQGDLHRFQAFSRVILQKTQHLGGA